MLIVWSDSKEIEREIIFIDFVKSGVSKSEIFVALGSSSNSGNGITLVKVRLGSVFNFFGEIHSVFDSKTLFLLFAGYKEVLKIVREIKSY